MEIFLLHFSKLCLNSSLHCNKSEWIVIELSIFLFPCHPNETILGVSISFSRSMPHLSHKHQISGTYMILAKCSYFNHIMLYGGGICKLLLFSSTAIDL